MKRRDVLRVSWATALSSVAGCAAPRPYEPSGPRRTPTAPPPAPPRPAGARVEFAFDEATVATLGESMNAGTLTARALVEAYSERIAALDSKGPELRSIIEMNPDAAAIADALDEERRSKGARGPLHGIPILLKDNVGTADRTTTTAGSFALEGSIPARDSFVAKKLREAGAILLGKANLSEWANIRSTRSTSGWSARGGQCKNPYALDRNPCGSSSGPAVAVSANLVTVAIGTETDGSIVCPSSASGVVGIKPTVGLVSRSGIIPISHTQDTAGPMARSVADAAAVLTALAAADADDPATKGQAGRPSTDYTAALDPGALRNARIGVPRNLFGFSRASDAVAERALETLEHAGADVIDPIELPHAKDLGDAEITVLLYELKSDLNAYLAALGPTAPVKSLADVIAFNEKNREVEMPFFGQDLFEKAEKLGPLTETAYVEALARCRRMARDEGIDAVVETHRLDALVAPTISPAWTTDLVNGDRYLGGSSSPAAVAGYPSICVPAGFANGLPVGVTFFGTAWSEAKLIAYAYAFEGASRARRPPTLAPSIEIDDGPRRHSG